MRLFEVGVIYALIMIAIYIVSLHYFAESKILGGKDTNSKDVAITCISAIGILFSIYSMGLKSAIIIGIIYSLIEGLIALITHSEKEIETESEGETKSE